MLATLERSKQQEHGGQRHRPAERAPHGEAAHRGRVDAGRAQDGGGHLAERDEHRVARRMRLVTRDVEVTHPEREVDRVEILERVRQKYEVSREEDQQQRDGG